jgi:anaerobic selenocysteine-containing dehydrogenase
LDPLPNYTPVKEKSSPAYPLQLLTPKNLVYSINSSYVGVSEREKHAAPRLRMHQKDALARGIQDGDMVRMLNERGSMLIHVRISDTTRAGIVSMPHGWWASQLPGGSSPNAVTSDNLSDMGGFGDFRDSRVQVAKAV